MDHLERFITRLEATKAEGIIRKFDELGRIVIPVEFRIGKLKEGYTNVKVFTLNDYAIIEVLDEEENKNLKQVDELGRVVINKAIRESLNWNYGDSIEIWNFDKFYILKKAEPKCVFCGSKQNLSKYKGKLICQQCGIEIKER